MGVKVGQYFIEKKLITEKDLREALAYQKNHPGYLGEILLKLEMIEESALLHYLSKRFNVQYISSEKLEKMPVKKPTDVIPEKLAMEKNIFPLKYSFDSFMLTILTYEPQNIALFDELKVLLTGVHSVVPVVTHYRALKALVFKQYKGDLQAFDRLVKKGVDMNLMMPGHESVLGMDENQTLGSTIEDIANDSNEKAAQDKRESFSMIVNQGEILNGRDTTSVTASMISLMPTWAKEQKGQTVELLRIFANLLDSARDPVFFGHTQRVAAMTQEIGHEMSLSEVELHDLLVAAYIHDAGKKQHVTAMDIKQRLNPDRLVRYSKIATKLFSTVELSRLTFSYLSNMYETYNGVGFPHGLRLNEIPMGALILLMTDTFDYMTRISNIPAPTVFKQIQELRFFPEQLTEALKKTQQIDSLPQYSSLPHMEAVIISRRRFDVDDIAEKLNRLNVKTHKAEKIEKAAQIIKEKKDTVNFILCDVDMPESKITPLKFLSAIKHKKVLSDIPFYFFSQFSVEKNILTTARALKANGVFANYHPVEMTRKIVQEVQKLKKDGRTA